MLSVAPKVRRGWFLNQSELMTWSAGSTARESRWELPYSIYLHKRSEPKHVQTQVTEPIRWPHDVLHLIWPMRPRLDFPTWRNVRRSELDRLEPLAGRLAMVLLCMSLTRRVVSAVTPCGRETEVSGQKGTDIGV